MATMSTDVAVVAGVGPGLGMALARRFRRGGARVALLARRPDRLAGFAETDPEGLRPYACDATDPTQVGDTFARIEAELGAPDCVVFNAGTFVRGQVADLDPAEFERCWRVGCFGGFLVGQAAAKSMLPHGRGTILFTGATASLRGGAGFANLASPKFALRALAQSMARELQPKGIHVAHVIVDGGIEPPGAERSPDRPPADRLNPDDMAETYWMLHQQPRSAWTLELDMRPWVERF